MNELIASCIVGGVFGILLAAIVFVLLVDD